jgi:hypothetical protein
VNDGAIQPSLRIRVIRKDASSAGSDPRPAPVSRNGVTIHAGEKICKNCGDKLEDGTELATCVGDPPHRVHQRCVLLTGGGCPECGEQID